MNRNGRILAGFLALSVVAVLPVWVVSTPPLIDYPNHLARMHILMAGGSNAVLNAYYQIHWAPIPNLAMDLVVPPLARVVGLEVAGKLFISLTLILISSGTVALHYALHRRLSAWPLASFLLLYNAYLLWGFLNFLFGLGVALWLLAAWVRWRDTRAAWFVFPVAVPLLFFLHLMPFGIYLVVVAAYEGSVLILERADARQVLQRGLQLALQAVPVLCLLVVSSPTPGDGTGAFFTDPVARISALRTVFANYWPALDVKLTLLPLAALALIGLLTGKLVFERRMLVPFLVIVLVYFALPHTLLTSGGAFRRFTVPIALLFVASTDLRVAPGKLRIALAAFIGILFLTRTAVLVAEWRRNEPEVQEYRQAIRMLPRGARLFPAFFFPEAEATSYLVHIPCMAVIDRDAFVPGMFASPRGQPIQYSEGVRNLLGDALPPRMQFTGREGPDWHALAKQYDYLLVTWAGQARPDLPESFERIAAGSGLALYRTEGAASTAAERAIRDTNRSLQRK